MTDDAIFSAIVALAVAGLFLWSFRGTDEDE